MKTIRIQASIDIEYNVEKYEEVTDSLVNDIIAHQIEGEIIAVVQNNANWSVEEDDYDIEDDYRSNMPCDNTGFCSGYDCKQYYECNA